MVRYRLHICRASAEFRKTWCMKPPIKKATQKTYVSSNFRMPVELRDELKESAERNGRSMNAEVIARVQAESTADRLDAMDKKLQDILIIAQQLRVDSR